MHIHVHVHCTTFKYYRVIKQTLRSSGANVTANHITEVSLAALFLLDAAKKTDCEFRVPPQSRQHTVRDATDDIQNITLHLMDKSVTSEMQGRQTSKFVHTTQKGWEKMSSPNWLAAILSGSLVEEEEMRRGEVGLDYELSDVL